MANEKRLIDANAFIAGYCKNCGNWCDLDDKCCVTVDDLMKAPTVDAVEVVRCKDCISAAGNDVKGYMCQNQLCPCYRRDVPGDFSCTCGERREP